MRRMAAVLLFLGASAAGAQQTKYVTDAAHSEINFVAESKLLDAHGFFEKWTADIAFDPTAWDKSAVKLSIDAKSINTRVAMRDNHLRSKDFFYADSFPQVTFASTLVNKVGENKLNFTGDLTIRGVTKKVTIPGTMVFWDDESKTGRVKGTFTIVRSDYGVSYNSKMNPIADEIPVTFNITFKAAP